MKVLKLVFVVFVSVVIFGSIGFCDESKNQKDEIEQTIEQILNLASQNDIATINEKYVHKEFGVFDVYRIGVPDMFEVIDALPLEANSWRYMPYGAIENVKNKQKIISQEYVEFDCGEFVYDKEGTFYSRKLHYPLPSYISEFHTKYENAKYDDTLLKKIEFLENNSIRVVDTSSDFIFYITKIDDKWYITLIDRVTTDCSA